MNMFVTPWITIERLQYFVVSISKSPVPICVVAVKGEEPVASDMLHTNGAMTSTPGIPNEAPTDTSTGYIEL